MEYVYNDLSAFTYRNRFLVEIKPQVYGVFIVLRYSKIAARDLKGVVIENIHYYHRRRTAFPCVIAKGFTQRMAGHTASESQRFTSGADQPVSLYAADRFSSFYIFYDEMSIGSGACGIHSQSVNYRFVKRYCFRFAGLFLNQVDTVIHTVVIEIVDVIPSQAQQIADSQRRM